MYKVFYLAGGYSNFVCKSTFTSYATKDEAKREVYELQQMGYIAMVQSTFKGGFESFDSPVFKTDDERKSYFERCKSDYSILNPTKSVFNRMVTK